MSGTPFDVVAMGFLSGHGGDALQMLEIASGAALRGLRVKIVAPLSDETLALEKRCRERNIPLERTPAIRISNDGRRNNIPGLLYLLNRHRGALLHYHVGGVFLTRSVLTAIDCLRLPPAIVTAHGPFNALTPDSPMAARWSRLVNAKLLVTTPSQHTRGWQLSYGVDEQRARTIPNGVNRARFENADPVGPRQQLGISADAPLAVFTSRLDPQKRPLDAVRAFEAVAEEMPDAHLALLGIGTMQEEVREAASASRFAARIHLPGYQPNVPEWLASATAWVFPTEIESFSMGVLEALAAGCAIVSTNCAGNDEVLKNEDNALLTEVGDVPAQAAALKRIFQDAELRARLQAAARRTAQDYSIERTVERYLSVYREVSPRVAKLLDDAAQ